MDELLKGIFLISLIVLPLYLIEYLAYKIVKYRDIENDFDEQSKKAHQDFLNKVSEIEYEIALKANNILEPQVLRDLLPNKIPYSEYKTYLASPEWKFKALQRLQLDNYHCQYCGSEIKSMNGDSHTPNVHHLHYRTLTRENVKTDIVSLCKSCHLQLHERYSLVDMEFHINNVRMRNQLSTLL